MHDKAPLSFRHRDSAGLHLYAHGCYRVLAIAAITNATIGTEEIGVQIVENIGHSPAILLAKHGVFTIGPTIEKAVQAAVMVEDVARTVAIAKGIGEVAELPAADIEANYDRYTHR